MKKGFRSTVSSYTNERGSYSLIGLLIGLVIMMTLGLLLLGGPEIFTGGDKTGSGSGSTGISGGVGGAIAVRDEAKEVACKNNLDQLRTGIQMASQSSVEGTPPQTLEEVVQANPGLKTACPSAVSHINTTQTQAKSPASIRNTKDSEIMNSGIMNYE